MLESSNFLHLKISLESPDLETFPGLNFEDGIACPSDDKLDCGESCPNFPRIIRMLERMDDDSLPLERCELTGQIPEI